MVEKNYLDAVEINPQAEPNAAVIWLHGLGADGYDFVTVVPELHLPEELQVRFIFPNAPLRSVTINAGYTMRAWFDIYALTSDAPLDEKGIRETQQQIEALIEREIERGILSQRIILAGFSQGGTMALHCGLRYGKPLAGIMGLSTFLLKMDQLPKEKNSVNDNTPIFLAHGTYDHVIPIQMGEFTKNILIRLGYPVEWRTYSMQHEVCMEEIRDISKWMTKQLKKA